MAQLDPDHFLFCLLSSQHLLKPFVTKKKITGLGPDGGARDPFNAQDGAAAPDGALRP